jgi:hypothetical protein
LQIGQQVFHGLEHQLLQGSCRPQSVNEKETAQGSDTETAVNQVGKSWDWQSRR